MPVRWSIQPKLAGSAVLGAGWLPAIVRDKGSSTSLWLSNLPFAKKTQLNVPRLAMNPPESILGSATHLCRTRCAFSEMPVKVKTSGRNVGFGTTYIAHAVSSRWEGAREKSAHPLRFIPKIVPETWNEIEEAWLVEASFDQGYVPLI